MDLATWRSLSILTEPFKWNRRGENKIRHTYGLYGQWKVETEIYSAIFKARLPSHVLEIFDYDSMEVISSCSYSPYKNYLYMFYSFYTESSL